MATNKDADIPAPSYQIGVYEPALQYWREQFVAETGRQPNMNELMAAVADGQYTLLYLNEVLDVKPQDYPVTAVAMAESGARALAEGTVDPDTTAMLNSYFGTEMTDQELAEAANTEQSATISGGFLSPTDPYAYLRNYANASNEMGNAALAAGQAEQQRGVTRIDYSQARQGLASVAQAAELQRQAALGQAPSVAELQLQSGQDAAARRAMSTALSAPGYDAALQRVAIESGMEGQLETNQAAAQLRAQEMADARNAMSATGERYANLAGEMASSQANFTESQRQQRYQDYLAGLASAQGQYGATQSALEFQAGYGQNVALTELGQAYAAQADQRDAARAAAANREANQEQLWNVAGRVGGGLVGGFATGWNPAGIAAGAEAGGAVASTAEGQITDKSRAPGYAQALTRPTSPIAQPPGAARKGSGTVQPQTPRGAPGYAQALSQGAGLGAPLVSADEQRRRATAVNTRRIV